MVEQAAHSISINGRKQLVLEGVRHVGSFDESEIVLETSMGALILKGEGLHITHLNLETGSFAAEGFFNSVQYVESREKGKGKSLLKRILK
ncbi:MAG: sporulation protein YabP [Pelotomaculum sp.]|uniref:Sporulation protein YabP n=1 Tax=Pelotomaculum thermopropionicum (strain DSM 13744 / JCM 10971 / SI) TaxID=370438 RepID=A5D644_PELTS|nr:sporulation protein YabP [Pelotomaculum sp.]BAF58305.1 hypothetical protein PTH_0124 [Pelotomaculum thermopropionicum SI]